MVALFPALTTPKGDHKDRPYSYAKVSHTERVGVRSSSAPALTAHGSVDKLHQLSNVKADPKEADDEVGPFHDAVPSP